MKILLITSLVLLALARTSSARGNCPRGWDFFFDARKCYKHIPTKMSFVDAQSLCKKLGGDVAVATSLGENNFISFVFTDQKIWLGGRRQSASSNEFDWILNGQKVSDTSRFQPRQFLPWNDGEPNNAGGKQDCVLTNFRYTRDNKGKWDDEKCNSSDPNRQAEVVCERKSA